MKPTPTTAPHGKAFQLVRLSHVAGPGVRLLHEGRPTTVRAEADKLARSFDDRLEPTVILVDQVRS